MRVKTTARRKPQKPRRPMPQELVLEYFGKCKCGAPDCVDSLLDSHQVAGYVTGKGKYHRHFPIWQSQN